MNSKGNNEHWKVLVLLLKEIAEEKGITHRDIADATGLQLTNVYRIFSCKYKPNLATFLEIANAIKVNFFFEDRESKTDLNVMFERAMEALGRRPDKLPKN